MFALAFIFLRATEHRQSSCNAWQAGLGQFPWVVLCPIWLIATGIMQGLSGMVDVSGSRRITELVLALGAAVIWMAWRQGRAASSVERQAMVDVLAISWMVAGLLGALAQWVQLFGLEFDTLGLVAKYPIHDDRRLFGNLNQPNHQATVEGLALAASIWLAARGRLRMPLWLAAVAMLESGIVLSGSRTGVVHVGLASGYAMIAAWMARQAGRGRVAGTMQQANRVGRGAMSLAVGLCFAAVAMLVLMMILQTVIKCASQSLDWRLFDTVARLQSSDQVATRGPMWAHGWAMFRAHLWLGVGWGEFGWAQFLQLEQVGANVEMSLHAHNALLDLMAKTGLIGATGVMLTLLTWFWRVLRTRLWRGSGQEREQALPMLVWMAMLCAHSMLEYPLHYLYLLLPFCFMLGWLEPSGFGRRAWPRMLCRIGGLALAAVTAVFFVTTWRDYQRVEAREAIDGGMDAALPMPRYWFLTYADADATEDAKLTPVNAAQLLEPHIAAVHLLPTPMRIARTAWLLALTGNPAEARLWLERLHYYREGQEAVQFAEMAHSCSEVVSAARPHEFCEWVQSRNNTFVAEQRLAERSSRSLPQDTVPATSP